MYSIIAILLPFLHYFIMPVSKLILFWVVCFVCKHFEYRTENCLQIVYSFKPSFQTPTAVVVTRNPYELILSALRNRFSLQVTQRRGSAQHVLLG